VLRFIPQANLSSLDAVAGTQYVVRNAAMLVWDTLYGVNSQLQPKPQMADSAEVSSDGLTWTFKLRPGLTFHDGEKVLPKDIAASLKRWMVRDTMGQIIAAQLVGMDGPHDQAVPQDAVRGGQVQLTDGRHHAGADRQHRSVQADHRVCRLRPDEIRHERVGAGQ
jgi:ABC-type transport system substrate-binding protein